MGFNRDDAWLCDLVPHSCVNPQQQAAIERAYIPAVEKHGLPVPSVPPVPKVLADDARREAILQELRESQAPLLVLLGDQPIKWFLRYPWTRLTDFEPYGHRHQIKLDGFEIDVLPLAHPRQVAKLGRASEKWFGMHAEWMKESAGR